MNSEWFINSIILKKTKYRLNIQFMNKALYNQFIVLLTSRLLQTNRLCIAANDPSTDGPPDLVPEPMTDDYDIFHWRCYIVLLAYESYDNRFECCYLSYPIWGISRIVVWYPTPPLVFQRPDHMKFIVLNNFFDFIVWQNILEFNIFYLVICRIL
jgi:hypothetical protein